MHIVFGMAADGGAYPAFPGEGSGVVGGAVLGPAGLSDLLAGQLGLSGPPVPPVVRIAAWQAKLEAAAAAAPRFFSRSLSVAPLSTARLLLSWRDDLVEAGWSPSAAAHPTPRVAALAAAELSPPSLPRGRQDMMREVLASVAGGGVPDVERIEVVEPMELLPPCWQRLLRALAERGVEVVERPSPPASPHVGDLGRVQRLLAGGPADPLVGDGSLSLLECRTAIMAAEAIADWVAREPGPHHDLFFVVPGGDSGLIDGALARRGLPVLGASPRSPHRGALQLLSLAFSVAWAPFDPQKLLELLLYTRPPIEPWAARLLCDALCREPGVGGEVWTAAWDAIDACLAERGDGDARAKAAEWRGWTEVGRHERSVGIPAPDAAAICDRVRRWALATDAGARDPLLLCVVGAADALAHALATLRRPTVPAAQVEGMIDLAIADGLPDPSRSAEEGAPRCVARPGAVWGEAARLVWWGFSGARARPRSHWTDVEAAALADDGWEPESDADAMRRDAAHWEQAVRATREAVVFVSPSLDRGAKLSDHPLAQRLGPVLAGDGGRAVRPDADALLTRGSLALAGRVLRRTPVAGVRLPAPCPTWTVPPAIAAAIDARRETASSLQDLVECQLRWLLAHVAGLGVGRALALPSRERLLGDLAHALARSVFPIGEVPRPAEVHRAAVELVDGLVDRVAAPLRLPGSSGELAFARSRIPESLASLARLLSRRGLSVVSMEETRSRAFGRLCVRGRVDMIVRDAAGAEAVIDLKWTRSGSRRRRELEEGRGVQLATYARLVAPAGGAPAGYFLLRQRELLAEGGSWLAPEGLSVEGGMDETWEAVAADWATLADLARSGRGLATGLPGASAHLPAGLRLPPPVKVCAACAMAGICRSMGEG